MSEACPALAATPAVAGARPSWLGWRGSGWVLVVDDDDSIRTVIARSVARLGFTVEQASGGREALSRFGSDPGLFSLVIVDFKLPDMDGCEVASGLRQIRPNARVILMSGLGREDAMEDIASKELTGFLQKPFALGALVTELRAVLQT